MAEVLAERRVIGDVDGFAVHDHVLHDFGVGADARHAVARVRRLGERHGSRQQFLFSQRHPEVAQVIHVQVHVDSSVPRVEEGVTGRGKGGHGAPDSVVHFVVDSN